MPATLPGKPQTRHQTHPKAAGDEAGTPEDFVLAKLRVRAAAPEQLITSVARENGIEEPRIKDAIMRLLEDRRIRFDLDWNLCLPRPTR